MRRVPRISLATLGALALALSVPVAGSAATPVSQSFTTPGEQPWVVPPGVSSVQVTLVAGHGAAGDDGTPGGIGATVTATLAVSQGESLYAEVGGNGVPLANEIGGNAGGYDGGGEGGLRDPFGTLPGGGGGGGASDVRRCSSHEPPAGCGAQSLASRLLVAGGGGGGGGNGESPPSTAGGNGGSADQSGSAGAHDGEGESGGSAGLRANAGSGGSAGSPSSACVPASGGGCPVAGLLGLGGAGGWGLAGGGGGGGGGTYGGGGGGGGEGREELVGGSSLVIHNGGGGGGGGGSSGIPGGAAGVSAFSLVPTAEGAQPSVTFTWTPSAPASVTGAPSALTPTTAALDGTVNPSDWLVSICAFALSPAPAGVATFPCAQQLGAGSTPVPVSATAAGLTPNTTYTVTLMATSVQGTGSGRPVTFTTPASSATPGGSGPFSSRGAGSGPAIGSLEISPTRFRRGKHAAVLANAHHPKPKATGTTISFQLSAAATVTLSFQRAMPGQLAGHSCLAPSRRRRRAHRCTRYTPVSGSIVLHAHVGSDDIHFQGALDGGSLLAPGPYRLTLVASDAAGETTAAQHPAFTLLG
jgi:hypothetical protein